MVGGCGVPDSNRRRTGDPASQVSPRVKRVRYWLRLLAAYSVALVNGAALLYITVRLLREGIQWLFKGT